MSGIKLPDLKELYDRMFRVTEHDIKKLKNETIGLETNFRKLSEEQKRAFEKIKKSEEKLNEQKRQINNLNDQINILRDKTENSRGIAEDWLKLIEYQVKILDNLMLKRLFPDNHQELHRHLELMQENINNEHYEATIGTAQICLAKIETLLPKVEEEYHEAVMLEEELNNINLQLANYAKEKYIKESFKNEDGEDVIESIPISYWAEDEWKEVQRLKNKIDAQMRDVTKLNLHDMQTLEQLMDQLNIDINDARQKALDRYVCSLRIMKMQENIAEKLIHSNFEIQDNIFEDNDERKANVLLMVNERNEKILTKFWTENEQIRMEIDFNTLDPLTRKQRLDNILKTVGAKDYKELPGYENKPAEEERFNLNRYQKTTK